MEKTAQKIVDYFFKKGTSIGISDYNFVLSILKGTIKAERERILKEIKELASDPPLRDNERRRGYHQACDEVIKIINK